MATPEGKDFLGGTGRQRKRRPSKATAGKFQGAANKTAARAHDAGAVGPYGPRQKRALRDSAIIARHFACTPQKLIAEEFGITERQVRNVIEQFNATPSPLDQRPVEIVEDLLRVIRREISDLEAMASRWEDEQPHVALGAKKAAFDALRQYGDLLEILGRLPEWRLVRAESELLRLTELVASMLPAVEARELAAFEAAQKIHDEVMPDDAA